MLYGNYEKKFKNIEQYDCVCQIFVNHPVPSKLLLAL